MMCKLFVYGLSRDAYPDSKVHVANLGPGVAGLHVGPMNIVIGVHSDSQLSALTETEGLDQQYLKWMGDIDKGKKQGAISGPLIFNIFLNCLFYFVKQGNRYNYADDNSISVSHES